MAAVNHLAGAHQAESHSSNSSFTARPPLPDRAVTPETIEDAYVDFIYHCNPALPLDTADTQSLREAFRNPPRSGGKVFEPFFIYQLVRRFYDKEIKTWTELTIKLGVEPPDPSKDESAQKIAQYGVRLKVRNVLHGLLLSCVPANSLFRNGCIPCMSSHSLNI